MCRASVRFCANQLKRVDAMKKTVKSIIIATVTAACLTVAGTASAGSSHNRGHGGGHASFGHSYSYGGGHGGHGGFGGHRSRHHGGHGVAYGLLGFGLGVMLLSAASQRNRGYSNYGSTPYYGSDYGYERRRAEPYRYEPAPARTNVVNPLNSTASSSCLQTREYQMVVIIGGEEKDAYGTACLQADGSWLQGPPTVVPDYN